MIKTIQQLDDVLTQTSEALNAFVDQLEGPLVVLGAGGKMGPSLCAMVRRAADEVGSNLEIMAVSRFSDVDVRTWLESRRIRTIKCDLFDSKAVEALPEAPNVIYLVGLKFGTRQNPALNRAANTLVPAHVSKKYPKSRMVVLSTGNVYPLSAVSGGGSKEEDELTPLGEYANACVARERIFEHFTNISTLRAVLVRLNYAVELRYGVLVDLAQKVISRTPIDVSMGYFNCIWQRDANDMIVRALELAASPAVPLNLTGPDVLSVREIAKRLGALMAKPVEFIGNEAETALLNDASRAHEGLPLELTQISKILEWTAQWVMQGGTLHGKATHFEVRDGRY